MKKHLKLKFIDYLFQHLTPERRQRIEDVLQYRTRHMTVVLENIYQPHNASAVVRSCDCFGIQDVHIIEKEYSYQVNKGVAVGAGRWVNMIRYREMNENNTQQCLDYLRKNDYRIVATTPNTNRLLPDLPIDRKLALVFGTEDSGVSELVVDQADEYIKIPMYGFTVSYNISVSVALCLYDLIPRIHQSDIPWRLTDDEIIDIRLEWIKKSLKKRYQSLADQFFEIQVYGYGVSLD